MKIPDQNKIKDEAYKAIKSGDVVRLCEILDMGLRVDSKCNDIHDETDDDETLLTASIRHGHLDVCVELLDRGANVELQDESFATPLYVAVRCGRLDICLALLNKGANPNNKTGYYDEFPLTYAVEGGFTDICLTLIDHGANIEAKNHMKYTPLQTAANYGHVEICLALIYRGADIEAVGGNGSALFVAIESNERCTYQALLDNGASTETRNYKNWTPLISASRHNNIDKALLLLQYGADIEATDHFKRTPVCHALMEKRMEMVLFLIANNASINDLSSTNEYDQRVLEMSPLEAASTLDRGDVILKVLESDSDPETLPTRAAQALLLAKESDKHVSVTILSSWISRQAAMAAFDEFAEPAIKHTSH